MKYNSSIKNQLFKSIPSRDVINKVIAIFGLTSLDDTRNFTRHDIEKLGAVNKMYQLKNILEEYYIPCKARTYLNDLNSKNIITVLRQLVRLFGYSVISREKYIKGDKFIIYQIISSADRNYRPITTFDDPDDQKKECIITFE